MIRQIKVRPTASNHELHDYTPPSTPVGHVIERKEWAKLSSKRSFRAVDTDFGGKAKASQERAQNGGILMVFSIKARTVVRWVWRVIQKGAKSDVSSEWKRQ